MATIQDYQRYRLTRREPHTAPKKLLGWGLIGLAVLVLVWAFTRGGSGNENAPGEAGSVGNVAAAEENVSGEAGNTNTNASLEGDAAQGDFASLDAALASYDPGTACEASISRTAKGKVVLTFGFRLDGEGYDEILTTLRDAGVPASFFASGNWAAAHRTVVQAVHDAGFPVYNQTQTHDDLTTLGEEEVLAELAQADETIFGITGRSTKPFMRPPYGAVDDGVLATAAQAGYCPVMWSVDALDWQTGATSFDVISRVMGRTSDGALVLMHVGSTATPPALTEIITRVREEGSAFVSLESLVSGNDTAS